jgi:DNA-binding transcriptional ArsR family regulator
LPPRIGRRSLTFRVWLPYCVEVTAQAQTDVFRAIADPTRRALLDLLRTGDRTVNELAEPFDMSRPAISQHLRLLLEARLVAVRKEGRQRRYRLSGAAIARVARWAGKFDDTAAAKTKKKR